MFTGIIQDAATVTRVTPRAGMTRLTIDVGALAQNASLGASIAVNGVCLTVAAVDSTRVEFDVIAETLRTSTLGVLAVGDRVNVEPSLRLGDSLDGHFVQGHVDGSAVLRRRDAATGEHVLWFEPQPSIRPYLIPKGSVALDGISLTIAAVTQTAFSVAIIPTTLERTNLNARQPGDRVNVETDILVRTIVHRLESMGTAGGITMDTLRAEGFA